MISVAIRSAGEAPRLDFIRGEVFVAECTRNTGRKTLLLRNR